MPRRRDQPRPRWASSHLARRDGVDLFQLCPATSVSGVADDSSIYGGPANSPPRTVEIRHAKVEPTTFLVGSGTARRMAISPPGYLRNSGRNGGRDFPVFVADPRTIRSEIL